MTKNEIQQVKALADKRVRDQERLFVAEGHKLVGELLASGLRVRRVYAAEGLFAADERIAVATPKELERISLLKTASDAVAVVEQPQRRLLSVDPARELVLALDEVQNPGNLGTIIRLADWFGIRHVVCSRDSADCFNPKVVQATMGAILRVEVHYADLAAWLRGVRAQGAPVYGTFLEGDNLYDTELTRHGVLLMGNEGRGVGEACAAWVDRKLFIPPWPADRRGSESLNVAIATAVACAEFRRRHL